MLGFLVGVLNFYTVVIAQDMVMMEKPSPIQVGREFVRQYYTLLNKAPALLHR